MPPSSQIPRVIAVLMDKFDYAIFEGSSSLNDKLSEAIPHHGFPTTTDFSQLYREVEPRNIQRPITLNPKEARLAVPPAQ